MNDSMIDRVGMALLEYESDWKDLDARGGLECAWHALTLTYRMDLREKAMKVIAAMREPTDRMLEAGWDSTDEGGAERSAWYAMIDAALEQKVGE